MGLSCDLCGRSCLFKTYCPICGHRVCRNCSKLFFCKKAYEQLNPEDRALVDQVIKQKHNTLYRMGGLTVAALSVFYFSFGIALGYLDNPWLLFIGLAAFFTLLLIVGNDLMHYRESEIDALIHKNFPITATMKQVVRERRQRQQQNYMVH